MLFRLWAKKFLKNDNADNYQERPSYHLLTAALKGLGNAIENARPQIPRYLGHAPRQINTLHNLFKAAE